MNTNEQAPECCPFCGAAMMGTRSTDGEYARYKCGNAFDARNASTREMQSKHCATAERERLTRERDEAKKAAETAMVELGQVASSWRDLLARVKRLEEAGDKVDQALNWHTKNSPASKNWHKAKEAKP